VLLACRIAPPLLVCITGCRCNSHHPAAAGISLLPLSCHHGFTAHLQVLPPVRRPFSGIFRFLMQINDIRLVIRDHHRALCMQ
jgi:hypothetical protein